jgi:predicted nucleic acid-binding protein
MAAFVLDTGILIRHLRRRQGFKELLERLAREGDLVIASFTRLEIVRGMRDHERERTLRLLDSLITHPLDIPTADRAGELIRQQLTRRMTIAGPDAVIAATAFIRDAAVVTANPRHFPFAGLKVHRVDEHGALAP